MLPICTTNTRQQRSCDAQLRNRFNAWILHGASCCCAQMGLLAQSSNWPGRRNHGRWRNCCRWLLGSSRRHCLRGAPHWIETRPCWRADIACVLLLISMARSQVKEGRLETERLNKWLLEQNTARIAQVTDAMPSPTDDEMQVSRACACGAAALPSKCRTGCCGASRNSRCAHAMLCATCANSRF